MKKEYSKPNMEIVSFESECIAADVSSKLTAQQGVQTKINTIKYY